jgi:dTDP-4-dehydrorhamnose 3,5-epimerase
VQNHFQQAQSTLWDIHYLVATLRRTKIVRCTQGSMIVGRRADSPTFGRHFGAAAARNSLYILTGFAHEFQALEEDTALFAQISGLSSPEHSSGMRWDAPAFQLRWLPDRRTLPERDRSYPDFDPAMLGAR